MKKLNNKNAEQYVAVDVTFHGRNQHPTKTFESAVLKAESKGSKVVRVYGIPRAVINIEKGLMYLGHEFSEEITEKILDGTLILPKGVNHIIDKETTERMKNKEKKRLKNLTRVFRK